MSSAVKKLFRHGAAALLACFAVLVLAACAPKGKPGTVQSVLKEAESLQKLQSSRTQSIQPLITDISIDGTALLQDTETGIYYCSLPQGKDFESLAILWNGVPKAQLAICKDSLEGGAKGSTLRLLAYTQTEYQELQLVCTTLPILAIEVPGDPAEIEKYESTPLNMTLYDNRQNTGLNTIQAQGSMHVRGVGSARFDKKGYRLTLRHPNGEENDAALLGLRADGDWILYAGYTESEKIRQVYTAELWRESCGADNQFDVQNSNEYKFLELFLNGRYWGLYALGYPIDGKQLNIGEGEHTFSKQDFLVSESGIDFDAPAEIPGYEVIAGDTVNTDWASIWKPLKSYYKTLLNEESDSAALKELADTNNAIDCWLFTNLVQGVDQVLGEGTLYNYRLSTKQTQNGIKILFTPWDFDLTWGAVSAEKPGYTLSPQENILMDLNPIYKLLQRGDAETLAAVQARYQELRAGAWSEEAMQAMLNGYEADIFVSGAYERDHARWPESAYNEGQTDLSVFRTYVNERLAAMDTFMQQLAPGTADLTVAVQEGSRGSQWGS